MEDFASSAPDILRAEHICKAFADKQVLRDVNVRLAPGENPDFPEGHDDKTHFNAQGADRICALVVEGMRKIPEAVPFLKPNH